MNNKEKVIISCLLLGTVIVFIILLIAFQRQGLECIASPIDYFAKTNKANATCEAIPTYQESSPKVLRCDFRQGGIQAVLGYSNNASNSNPN